MNPNEAFLFVCLWPHLTREIELRLFVEIHANAEDAIRFGFFYSQLAVELQKRLDAAEDEIEKLKEARNATCSQVF